MEEDQNQDFLPIQTFRNTSWFWAASLSRCFLLLSSEISLFPFSLLSPVVSSQSTFPGLCRTDCTFVILPCICVSEVSMLMFLLLVRKRMYSRNKKRSFISLCNKDSFFPPVSIFRGCGGGSCI